MSASTAPGIPNGLRGKQIPLLARVTQIADIYDALTSQRCYKPAFLSAARAMKIILEETDRGWRRSAGRGSFLRCTNAEGRHLEGQHSPARRHRPQPRSARRHPALSNPARVFPADSVHSGLRHTSVVKWSVMSDGVESPNRKA